MSTTNSNLSSAFIDIIDKIDSSYLTERNVLKVKYCLIDYMAASYSGIKIIKQKIKKYCAENNDESKKYSLIASNERTNIENAIFLNGLISHAAELDDGSRFGMIHPGSPVFSALIPVAKKYDITFEQFTLGVLTAYETSIRLARAIAPGHYNMGYHPTATCGTVGVAIGIAKMLKFSRIEIENTFAAALISASGSLKVIEDESEIKPLNVGNAARNGLYAANIGRAGFKGADDPLAGKCGFLNMMSTIWNDEYLIKDLDCELQIHTVYFKPYAACRHAHAPIEAVLLLRDQVVGCISCISEINVYTYEGIIGKHDSKIVNNETSAKMSIPYCVSVALLTGEADLDKFKLSWVHKLEVQNLIKKINVIATQAFTEMVPKKRCAEIEIKLKSGTSFTKLIEYPKGEPENPMTYNDLMEKLSRAGNGNEVFKKRAVSEKLTNIPTEFREFLNQ